MKIVKYLLVTFYIILLIIPAYTIITNSGGISSLLASFISPQSTIYLFVRLFALYAFVLLFIQLLVGAFMFPLRRLFGSKILPFHITQGILIYIFILTHPLLYVISVIMSAGWTQGMLAFVPKFTMQEYYLNLGRAGLILFTIAIAAGYFRTKPFLATHWRKFHIINYLAFLLIILHSYGIGSDTHAEPFIHLYPLFFSGLIAAFGYRRAYIWGRSFLAKKMLITASK